MKSEIVECRMTHSFEENELALIFLAPSESFASPYFYQDERQHNPLGLQTFVILALPVSNFIICAIEEYGSPIGLGLHIYSNRFVFFEFPKRKNSEAIDATD